MSFSEASKAPTPTAALDVFFDELRAKAKTLALESSLREEGIDGKLLKRSLERQRSTEASSEATAVAGGAESTEKKKSACVRVCV